MINNKPSSEQTSWQDRLSCRLLSLLYTTAIVEAVVQYTLQRFPEEASLRECLLRIEQLFWNSWLSLPPFWSFARPPKRSQKTLRVKFVPRFPIVSGVGNCSQLVVKRDYFYRLHLPHRPVNDLSTAVKLTNRLLSFWADGGFVYYKRVRSLSSLVRS